MIRIACIALLFSTTAFADDTAVRGHVRKDGTYVAPHYRTTPDSTRLNNYGSQGNYNPHTGNQGTVNPYTPPMPTYTPPPVYQPQFQPAPAYQPYQPYRAPRTQSLQ